MGWVRLQKLLQMRMRNSSLIQKPQERVKDQNDTAREETTNRTFLIHQRNEWQKQKTNQVTDGDQGKSLE